MENNTSTEKDLKENFKYIDEAPKKIYWPTTIEKHSRLVRILYTDKDLISIKLGKEQYLSDVLLNVEPKEKDEIISFNVNDLIGSDKEPGKDFTTLGNILFIDKDDNHVILTEKQYVKISNHIFYAPKDIYLSIDLATGNFVFKNADKDSELYVKYLVFFLIRKEDYAEIEREVENSTEENRTKINSSIEGYNDLTTEQKKEVDGILDKLIYSNKDAHLDQFVTDTTGQDKETNRLKIPLNDDGTVDINLFTNQICPKYAEKEVDLSITEFEKVEKYVPLITEKDYTNLGFIGFAPKDTKSLVNTVRDMLINTNKTIEDLTEKIEAIKEQYNKSLSTCCSLISTGVYDSSNYDQGIKNNYTPLAMMKEYENMFESAADMFQSSQQTLASFQNISRRDVQKAINDGEFTNKHTFASLTIFFRTMLRLNFVTAEDASDNYGVYNSYLKYTNSKAEELLDNYYFNNVLANTLNPSKDNNIYNITVELFNRFVRISDLRDTSLEKGEVLKRIMERVNNRIDYLMEVSYYPITIASYVFDLAKTLSFSEEGEDIDLDDMHKTFVTKHTDNKWPAPESISIKNHLVEKVTLFKSRLDNPDRLECLISFLKTMRLISLNEYMVKVTTKRSRTDGEMFHISIIFNLLDRAISTIDMITQKRGYVLNDENKLVERDITDREVKCLLARWLIRLACFIIFTGTSLRLSNEISRTALEADKINENDSQTFFSVILNGLILNIELLNQAIDKGVENDTYLDTVIQEDRLRLLGGESSKIFYSGLKGMCSQSKDEKQPELIESTPNVSRLFAGRKELMEQSVHFTEMVFDILNIFISDVTNVDPEDITIKSPE